MNCNFLNYNVGCLDVYYHFLEAIQNEKNEFITNYLSGRIQNIFWGFLSEEQRNKISVSNDIDLFELLEKDISPNLKRTFFGLYRSIAISQKGKERLYQIWTKKKKIKNLYISENDFAGLAVQLAIYKHPKATEILTEQLTRISNPDRLKRFKWMLPSLSNNALERDAFMRGLLKKENREKESWVQGALSNIHHPLRQKEGIKHFKSCLDVLKEIQLTGDIFFPKGWLSSSVGRYSSKEAFDILQGFFKENPNYNPILKMKLLQTTDNLSRAQKIKK